MWRTGQQIEELLCDAFLEQTLANKHEAQCRGVGSEVSVYPGREQLCLDSPLKHRMWYGRWRKLLETTYNINNDSSLPVYLLLRQIKLAQAKHPYITTVWKQSFLLD